MSYTRSYTGTVPVSGAVDVSYPPSEHGGRMSVPYNVEVPLTFNITVDTEPFDKSVNTAELSVDGLTASVAAMNVANCATIIKCSDKISDTIVDGFYNLIQSDISTQKAEKHTLIQAKSALLMEHTKAVADKHERMLRDVDRERAKYGQVFSELDKELERRITQLDRPAFNLGKKVRNEVIFKPYLTGAASAAINLGAGGDSRHAIAVAGFRQKALGVLRFLTDWVHGNLMYRNMMSDILWKKTSDELQQVCVPVAYCISENNSGSLECKCYASETAQKNRILNTVAAYAVEKHNTALPKDIPESDMKFIEQAFLSMVQDSFTGLNSSDEREKRVYTEILRLWQSGAASIKRI